MPEPEVDESGIDPSDDESETELAARAVPIRRYRPPYKTCMSRLPAPLNPSRRVAREANATLPRSRLRCAR